MGRLLEIKTRKRQYSHNRHMADLGYRKQYTKLISKASKGITHHLTMPSLGGTAAVAKSMHVLGAAIS